ncbi:MAG: hypothetical protein ACI915_001916 [Gammaproteobacteria bacterium]|jgi:hypothetical protein
MLARIPYDELSRPISDNGALQVLTIQQSSSALAYGGVTDKGGAGVTELVTPGMPLPDFAGSVLVAH